ncbi:MAG: thioredoxin family protein [Planctomycetes bacterium]|nr:thioredoxin family protein [Planctomycetota bacterium]
MLSGRLGVETFVLTTEYGRLTIAVKQIVRLTSTQAPAKPTAAAVSRANILHYDDKTWRDETINSSTVTIVTAWAPWAAPSVKTVSVLTKAAGDYRGKLQFVLLDIDRGKRTAEKLGIKAVPSMLIFRDGKLLEKRTGAMTDEAELRQWLDSIYQKHRSRTSNRNPFDGPFRGR